MGHFHKVVGMSIVAVGGLHSVVDTLAVYRQPSVSISDHSNMYTACM